MRVVNGLTQQQAGAADGADVAAEQLHDAGLAGGDGGQAERGQTAPITIAAMPIQTSTTDPCAPAMIEAIPPADQDHG